MDKNLIKEWRIWATAILVMLFLVIYSLSFSKQKKEIHEINRRLEFIVGVISDYDREIQHEKSMNEDGLNRYDLYYGPDSIWKDIK